MFDLKKEFVFFKICAFVPHLNLLLQLTLFFSIHSDGKVLGRVHCRVTSTNLVRVKGPFNCVPLIFCE